MIFEDLFHICWGSDAECLSGASVWFDAAYNANCTAGDGLGAEAVTHLYFVCDCVLSVTSLNLHDYDDDGLNSVW